MGRFEKYQAYREQIKNEWQIKEALNDNSLIVEFYCNEIKKISPKILNFYKPISIKLTDLLTIDSSKKNNINEIQSFINDFNSSELANMQEQAELLLMQSNNDRPSEFEEGWLDQDIGTAVINKCNIMFNNAQNQNMYFDKNSYEDLARFKNIVNLAKENRSKINEVFISNKEFETKHHHSRFLLYCISLYGIIIIGFLALAAIIAAIILA